MPEQQFVLHYQIRVTSSFSKQSKAKEARGPGMGQNYVSRVGLHKRTWYRGMGVPHVRPYCTQSLGLKIPAVLLFGIPESGSGRPEGAENALKMAQNHPKCCVQNE